MGNTNSVQAEMLCILQGNELDNVKLPSGTKINFKNTVLVSYVRVLLILLPIAGPI